MVFMATPCAKKICFHSLSEVIVSFEAAPVCSLSDGGKTSVKYYLTMMKDAGSVLCRVWSGAMSHESIT